ncbi:acyl-CoA carboxylase epsilon subunit [Kibdelosporangium phytohabitans]|uniref:acyl-CoA carboxylase epsilon subunit n=1 Tax=Kibdelosporangium phytohabitans TaxID=860235 RepID=UPI0009F89B3C|nr:acyl-CoA carboxylase epsilon subunit [Kibdelosporangium phytohabitans]MBE1462086.1 hypothetical protein [Kibdelosporangium phytohabitans]
MAGQLFSVVRGLPDDHELAALTVALAALSRATAPQGNEVAKVRRRYPMAGSWRAPR